MRGLRFVGLGAFWVVALAAPRPGRAQAASRDSTRAISARLFARLGGKWSCKGGFARGGALEADLAFTPALGGNVMSFEHVDRAPGVYWQHTTWAIDAKLPKIVSVGIAGSQKDMSGAPAGFSSTALSDTSITLQADTLATPPFATNRFTYLSRSRESLEMRWEVLRNAAWSLGDSLVCERAKG
jgi:hypothetical protein